MAKNDDLLVRLVDSMARVESKLEQWGNIPARIATIEEKFAAYENQAKGGWKAVTLAWTIILAIGGAAMFFIENFGGRIFAGIASFIYRSH